MSVTAKKTFESKDIIVRHLDESKIEYQAHESVFHNRQKRDVHVYIFSPNFVLYSYGIKKMEKEIGGEFFGMVAAEFHTTKGLDKKQGLCLTFNLTY